MNSNLKNLESISTEYGRISFRLVRSHRRKTVAIHVNENADVSVLAPFFIKQDMIFDFIREKSCWIVNKIEEVKKRQIFLEKRRFDNGFMFLFLGHKYPLIVVEDENRSKHARIDFDGTAWTIKLPYTIQDRREDIIKKKLIGWYKIQAKELLPSRVFYYSRIIGVESVNKIVVKTQKRLWGNCDYTAKIIRLNWQIILAPLKVIDYVVVHEICHLIFPNHSRRFWRKVGEIFPQYKESRRWLREHYMEMSLS